MASVLLTGRHALRTVIVVADAGNGRIVPMDDPSGAGWTSFTYPRTNPTVIEPTPHFAVGAGWPHMSIDDHKPGTDARLFDLAYAGPRRWFS